MTFERHFGFGDLPHYYDEDFTDTKSLGGLFVKELTEQQSSKSPQYVCTTKAKQCAGQDPCYFDDEWKICGSGFRIKMKKVGGI